MGVYLATRCLPNESHSVFGSGNGMATQMAERNARLAITRSKSIRGIFIGIRSRHDLPTVILVT